MPADYNAERYNRRTRAIERQAAALEAIADALRENAAAAKVSAIAAATAASASQTSGVPRVWKPETAGEFMNLLAEKVRGL